MTLKNAKKELLPEPRRATPPSPRKMMAAWLKRVHLTVKRNRKKSQGLKMTINLMMKKLQCLHNNWLSKIHWTKLILKECMTTQKLLEPSNKRSSKKNLIWLPTKIRLRINLLPRRRLFKTAVLGHFRKILQTWKALTQNTKNH